MDEQHFKLKEDQPYIALNKLLQLLTIAQTGGHAKVMIRNEEVTVNGVIETRVRKKLVKSDYVVTGAYSIRIS